MSESDESGGWLSDAVSDGIQAITEYTSFLGVRRPQHVCPDCNTPCEETRVYDPRRAAFHDGGESPAWTCPECGKEFVREDGDEMHTLDLYGRE